MRLLMHLAVKELKADIFLLTFRLQKNYWKNVVNLRTFDIVTFVCPNTKLYMAGSESAVSPLTLNQNLYVKEIPEDIENFEGACDIKGIIIDISILTM